MHAQMSTDGFRLNVKRPMKLKLFNIQGHKNSVFEIQGGINVIIGSSDSGKSTVVRALRWLVFNKPASTVLKRNGASRMYVQLTLDDGTTIRRERSKTENIYKLNNQVLKSFGAGVPMEISEALNMSEFNIKSQHDSFFFLSESGPERARILNQFLDLDKISTTMKSAAAKVREARAEFKALESLETEAMEAAKEEQPYCPMEVVLLCEKAEELQKELQESEKLIQDYREYKALKKELKALKNEVDCLSTGLIECERLMLKVQEYERLQEQFEEVLDLEKKVKAMGKEIKQTREDIELLDLARCKACGTILVEESK